MDQSTLMNLLASNVSSVNTNVRALNDSLTPAVNGLSTVVNLLVEQNRELCERLAAVEATLVAAQPKPKTKVQHSESSEAPVTRVTKKAQFKNFNLWVKPLLEADFTAMESNMGQQTTVFSDSLAQARASVKVPKGTDAQSYVGSVSYNGVLSGKLYNILNAVCVDTANPNSNVVSAYLKPLREKYTEAKRVFQVSASTTSQESDVADLLSAPSA